MCLGMAFAMAQPAPGGGAAAAPGRLPDGLEGDAFTGGAFTRSGPDPNWRTREATTPKPLEAEGCS